MPSGTSKWFGKLENAVVFSLGQSLSTVLVESIYDGLCAELPPDDIRNIARLYQLGNSRTWCVEFHPPSQPVHLYDKTFKIEISEGNS